ncbi:hypothetical protein QJQ45_029323 [Haematococcus lacustris]|nr:hypothetical protein QJQ45_029323 [Haematococcus lacustris]
MRQPGRRVAPESVYTAALLCTGTVLALAGQYVSNVGASHPSAQLPAFTKYAVAVASTLGATSRRRKRASQRWSRADLLSVAIGCLEVVAYSLSCLGFPRCGSALAMVVFAAAGQVLTAIMRTAILRKGLSRQQLAAVVVVTLGLVVRWLPQAAPPLMAPGSSQDGSLTPGMQLGVAYLVASAAAYSLLGVLYELLVSSPSNKLSQAEVWNLRHQQQQHRQQ